MNEKGYQILLDILFILMFIITVVFTSILGINLIKGNNWFKEETVNTNNNCIIVNNSSVNINVDENTFIKDEEIVYENINYIDIIDGNINYNLVYDIKENTFKQNTYSTLNSPLLVRFSYSYDNINYTKINNVLSLGYTTISPLIGSYYDISGITGKLNVLLNRDISKNVSSKIYFKSETVIKKNNSKVNNSVKADFKIENNY